jgi:hypothetical protein
MIRKVIGLVFLVFGASVSGFAADDEFQFPATGVTCAKQAMFLGIDDVSFPLRHNVVVQVSKPEIRPEAVLYPSRDNPNAPDNLAANFYGTVLHEPGITPGSTMRMWYYGLHQGRNPDLAEELKPQADTWQGQGWNTFVGPVCYAESKDGIHWEKVNLGQLLFKGNRDNNAFDLGSALTAEALVIKDEEDPDPQRRYKMTFWVQHHPLATSSVATIQSATSPDGIKWKTAEKLPMPSTFREEGSFYKHNGFYFAGAQTFEPGPNGRNIERAGTTFVSPDFDHWLHETSRSLVLPRGAGGRRFEPHLGMGAKSFGNVLVGIYGRWDGPNHIVGHDITADLGLVVSNDGMKFREPDPEAIFISAKESPAKSFTGRKLDTQRTVLCQGNGILNVGDQTLIYYGRWARRYDDPSTWVEEDYSAEVALATLPRDRWGQLRLTGGSGSVWTTPVVLPKNAAKMFVNCEGAKGFEIEVADARFGKLEGFSGKVEGAQGLDCPVHWQGKSLSELAGKTVRFRIAMRSGNGNQPRLYALYLRTE